MLLYQSTFVNSTGMLVLDRINSGRAYIPRMNLGGFTHSLGKVAGLTIEDWTA
jgi:hypothetical protein